MPTMSRRWWLPVAMAALAVSLSAQTNVRAWSAQGQVWIVWDHTPAERLTNAVWRVLSADGGAPPPTARADWRVEARLFDQDARVERVEQMAPLTTLGLRPVVPKPGHTFYRLATHERAAVLTPHENRDEYYAVVLNDDDSVEFPQRTLRANSYRHAPLFRSVQPVLQWSGQAPGALPYACDASIYCVWADGRHDFDDNRPDVPVLANEPRNSTPHLYLLYRRQGQATATDVVHFLHGADGNTANFRPGNGPGIDLMPDTGLLIVHDDALYTRSFLQIPYRETTTWFGYDRNLQPFVRPVVNNPAHWPDPADPTDIIVNYTQRRVGWINAWAVATFGVPPDRCALMGFSLGGLGVSHMARAFPGAWSSATMFSCNPQGPESSGRTRLVGGPAHRLPTNLTGPNGTVMTDVLWRFDERISNVRDLPVMRLIHGFKDTNPVMGWDDNLLDAVFHTDALGLGFHFYWDEREHVARTPDAFWSDDPYGFDDKILRSSVGFQKRYSSTESYPAFFFHRRLVNGAMVRPDPQSDTPGTWSGHAEWGTPIDSPTEWRVEAWLIDEDYSDRDRSAAAAAFAHVALRRPRAFLPQPGKLVHYEVSLAGAVLEKGTLSVAADGLVRLDRDVPLFRGQPVEIRFTLP